jgi:hypothetical protein
MFTIFVVSDPLTSTTLSTVLYVHFAQIASALLPFALKIAGMDVPNAASLKFKI